MKCWQSNRLAAPMLAALGWAVMAQPASAQIRVACVGDSITYGVNLSGAGTATGQTYPGILQSDLGSGYNVQNFGYPGLSLMSLPNGNPSSHPAYTSTSYYTNSINFNPNIVIIMLGTNDASFAPNSGQTWSQTYQSLYISQYESLIQAYQNCPAHPVVYVMACTRVTGTNQYGIDPNVLNTIVAPTDYTIAAAAHVPLIDAWTASSPYGADYQDGVHPTAPLDQVIGNTVYNAISTYNSAPPATPAAPSGVTAHAGNGANTISWTVPSGWVTAVNIYRSTTAGGEGTTPYVTAYPNRLNWFTDTAVTNGTKYYYKVAAVNSAGTSALSSEVSATPASGAYSGFPYTGTAQAIPGTIFADTYDNGGQNIAYNSGTATWNIGGFYRYFDGVSIEQNGDTTSNGYDVGWNYTGYYLDYTVNVATAGTYNIGFRVANGGSSAGSLHLQNIAGTNLTGTVSIPSTGGWQTWQTVNATATLPAGVQTLQLAMDNASYNINYISFAQAGPPAAPSSLAATAGNNQVALTWTAGSGATSYNIYRGTASGGESATPIATGVTATTYTDTTAVNGTKYYYQVASVNASGTSAKSNEASATPAVPTAPIPNGTYTMTPQNATGSCLDATNGSTTSGTQLQIWQATSGDTNQEWVFTYEGNGYYLIQPAYSTSLAIGVAGSGTANGTAVDLLTNTGATNQLWQLTTVSGGYTLSPENAPGSTMNVSGPSSANGTLVQIWTATGGTNTIFALTAVKTSAPAAPTGLTATAGTSQVSLSWTAASGATSYNIYRGTTSGGESATAIATGVTSTSYTDTSVTNGTTYYYKVAAVNSAGTSAQSNEASAAPTAPSGPIANGTYDLTPQNATGSRVDAQSGGTANGTAVQIWQYSAGDANQHWIFTNEGGSVYKIQPAYDTGLALDVSGAGSANGTAVQLWTDNGTSAQRWAVAAASGGYTFTPQCATGSTLNVSGPSSANGTLLQIWQATGGTNTIFAVTAAN